MSVPTYWPGLVLRAILIICLMVSAKTAAACAFHFQLPEKTVGDYLMESPLVVLARENTERQWTFRAVATLKGEDKGMAIDALVPSTTRRRLANNPGDTVLFAQTPDDRSWRRLAYVRSDLRPLYETMVRSSKTWAAPAGPGARFRFFAGLHAHPDRSVRQTALAALDRAAYRDLREMQIAIPAKVLKHRLRERLEQPWAPIRILMIGILGDADSKVLVSEAITSAEKSTWSMHLGAWATALIEIEGTAGIDRLRSSFLLSSGRSEQQIEAVLTALAVHGAGGHPNIGDAVDSALSMALEGRPDLAVAVARIFGAQGDYSRASLLSEALKQHRLVSPADIISVATYISIAQQSKKSQQVTQIQKQD